jgi:hypothetical protein
MDDAVEGRIRALQRIAYGADATDAERARAIAELVELAVHAAGREVRSTLGTGEYEPSPTSEDASDVVDVVNASDASAAAFDASAGASGSPASHAAADASSGGSTLDGAATERRTLVRFTVVAGAVGLLLGAAIGWGMSQRAPAGSIVPPVAEPAPSATSGTLLDRTDLLPLFDRLPLAAESARVADVDATIDPASVRLLATRSDGPSAYLTRTIAGDDVCLVLMLPAGPSSLACTIDGIVPPDGLRIQYYARGYGLAVARLVPSGTVTLGLMVTF